MKIFLIIFAFILVSCSRDIKIACVGGGSFEGKPESVPEKIAEYPDSDMFGNIPSWGKR